MNSVLNKADYAIWHHEFTSENILDYARASRDLSAFIRVLNSEGYRNLVVPSRGAIPFVRAATYAYMIEGRSQATRDARLKQKYGLLDSPFMRKIVLPFSADPNESRQTSAAIREYWSRVLAATVRRDGRDPHLTFYKFLVEKLAKRTWLDAMGRDLPTEKFIFIDTVISGRAICEIIEAFDQVGLAQCYFILLADKNGSKIEPQYKRIIDQLCFNARCTLIPISRMFTEDRGPGASGVWSTVYPQVLDAVQQTFSWGQQSYGGGSFYHLVSSAQTTPEKGIGTATYNMPVTLMNASIKGAIHSALEAMQQIDQARDDLSAIYDSAHAPLESQVADYRMHIEARMKKHLEFELDEMRESFEELGSYTPLSKETTRILAEPRVKSQHPDAEVEVSSSHLIRVFLPAHEIDAFMHQSKREIAAGHDVFATDYFR